MSTLQRYYVTPKFCLTNPKGIEMSNYRREPLRGFETLAKKMSEYATDFAESIENGSLFATGSFNPRVDLTEKEDAFFIHAELPGISKENVNITVSDDKQIVIKGHKNRDINLENTSVHRVERLYGEFTRTFILPETADLEQISAKFENGLLELSIAKKPEVKPKEIKVEIE